MNPQCDTGLLSLWHASLWPLHPVAHLGHYCLWADLPVASAKITADDSQWRGSPTFAKIKKLKQKANEEISQARPRTVCSKPIIPVFKRPASAQGKDPTPRPPSGPPAKKAKMATPSEPPPTTQTRIRLTGVYGL